MYVKTILRWNRKLRVHPQGPSDLIGPPRKPLLEGKELIILFTTTNSHFPVKAVSVAAYKL